MKGLHSFPKAHVEEINVKVNENAFFWSLAKEDSVKAKIEEVGSENELHIKEDDGEDEENASFIEIKSGKQKVKKSKRSRKGKR